MNLRIQEQPRRDKLSKIRLRKLAVEEYGLDRGMNTEERHKVIGHFGSADNLPILASDTSGAL